MHFGIFFSDRFVQPGAEFHSQLNESEEKRWGISCTSRFPPILAGRNDVTETLGTKYCFKMAAADVEIWASLDANFIGLA